MSKQNVASFDRNGKSKHIKICLSVVHTCTEKGSAQDGLAMEKSSFWLLFSQKNYLGGIQIVTVDFTVPKFVPTHAQGYSRSLRSQIPVVTAELHDPVTGLGLVPRVTS
jgi:hypothetical protein